MTSSFKDDFKSFETLAVHAGVEPDPTTGAIMTPIYATSTYVQSSPGKHRGYEYSRTANPTRTALETSLAALEGGGHALALSSGCTATDVILHLLEAGDEVICCDDVYGGTSRLFRTIWSRHGVKTTFVDLTKVSLDEVVTDRTRLIWLETPTNPMLKILDIRQAADWAANRGQMRPLVVVDNTFATPYFQRPLALGADIVVHSTTKYLNGHSDVVGGAIIVKDEALRERLHYVQNSTGGISGPFDSWLTLRGIKTLALRMERHEKSAMQVAEFLESHAQVERVIYPGLESHPQHALAKRQMRGFGGMITFNLKGNLERSRTFLESLKVFSLAESLGGVESLVEHPAIMTHASLPAETRSKLGISDTLVRLSVGIETLSDLIEDLDQALRG